MLIGREGADSPSWKQAGVRLTADMGTAASQPAVNKRSDDIAFLLRHTNFSEEKLCKMQSAFLEDAVDGSITRQSFVDMFTAAFFPSNPLGGAQQLGQQVAAKGKSTGTSVNQ